MDTSNIDIKAVIDQLACIAWKKPVRSRGQLVYKGGPCPFCHLGNDRFAVFPEGEKPHFYCGIHGTGCGAHGDVISFVQQIKGYSSVQQAIQELNAMGFPVGDGRSARPFRKMPAERGRPDQKWQEAGHALVHAAQRHLWSAVGKAALEYLRGRGLTDETIQRFCLGYWPQWKEFKLADWGLEGDRTFWIRPGILIPCTEKGVLWSINQRITEYTAKEREEMVQGKQLPRYKQIRGSSNGLFNVDAIRPEEPLFVTEGEIDAMTIVQEMGYSAVATGSTQGAKLSRWIITLSVASHLLIAFDNDEGKGEKAAEYWTKTIFPQMAFYWQPWAKDVNEMLELGQDLTMWASLGIKVASPPPHVESSGGKQNALEVCVESSSREKPNVSEVCSVCRNEVEMFSPEGTPYCPTCYQKKQSAASNPLDDPVVQEVIRLFNATVITEPRKLGTSVYTPRTLPALPRAKCPHEVLYESKGRLMKRGPCHKPTLAHGWCAEHAASPRFLDLGEKLNYPVLMLDRLYIIGAGIEEWEEHAVSVKKDLKREFSLIEIMLKNYQTP